MFDSIPTQIPCTNETLDAWLNIEGCCNVHDRFKHDLATVMKLMKYAMQPPHFAQKKEEFLRDFGQAKDYLPYTLMKLEDSCEQFDGDEVLRRICSTIICKKK